MDDRTDTVMWSRGWCGASCHSSGYLPALCHSLKNEKHLQASNDLRICCRFAGIDGIF